MNLKLLPSICLTCRFSLITLLISALSICKLSKSYLRTIVCSASLKSSRRSVSLSLSFFLHFLGELLYKQYLRLLLTPDINITFLVHLNYHPLPSLTLSTGVAFCTISAWNCTSDNCVSHFVITFCFI